jgi:acetyltransferase EpsM
MQKLWVYGAGGHARVMYEVINASGVYDIIGFIDDDETRTGEIYLGFELITNIQKFVVRNKKENVRNMFIAIGDNTMRERVANQMVSYQFPVVIHSSAVVSKDAKIGSGTVIMPGAIIEPQVNIGEHSIVNTGAIIGHSSNIGDFCHIAGNSIISGEVTVGKASFVAIGSCVTPQITIGNHCIIGAGSVITRDVPNGAKMFGNPARNIEKYTKPSESKKT